MRTVLLLALPLVTLPAQTLTQPPPLIRLIQMNGGGTTVLPHPGAGIPVIGMVSITGILETWLLEPHDSFADIEQADGAYPGLRGRGTPDDSARTWIAFYRQPWSHRPDEAIRALRNAHYLEVAIFRIGLGSESDFAELLRAREANFDRLNIDRPDLVYQVLAGDRSGTYVILSPLPSLKALDEGVSTFRSAAGYQRSTGTPSTRAASKVDTQSDVSYETILFRIAPGLSEVPEEFTSADPEFWKSAAR
jgi:hypothetical protein